MNNKLFLMFADDLKLNKAERYLAAQLIQNRPVCEKIKHYTEKLSQGLDVTEVQTWVFIKTYSNSTNELIDRAKTAGCFL